MSDLIMQAVRLAIKTAKEYEGATAPNPIVGAVGLTEEVKILGVAGHEKAGGPHAEVNLIQHLRKIGRLEALHTLFITLEPCMHYGRTPPCVDKILQTNVKKIIIGTLDPNPKVNGRGFQALSKKVETIFLSDYEAEFAVECQQMIVPYSYWVKYRRPWVILKQAYNLEGSMIPRKNKKTFTSQDSLIFAHELRKKSDAILTGSGTILADLPEFTVRYVSDHKKKTRWLVFFDRRKRVPDPWKERAVRNGFCLKECFDFEETLAFLGRQGVHIALVEAGPILSSYVDHHKFWNEKIQIFQAPDGQTDRIVQSYRDLKKYLPLSPTNAR